MQVIQNNLGQSELTSKKLKLHLFFRIDGPHGEVPAKQEMPRELTLGLSCSRWKPQRRRYMEKQVCIWVSPHHGWGAYGPMD